MKYQRSKNILPEEGHFGVIFFFGPLKQMAKRLQCPALLFHKVILSVTSTTGQLRFTDFFH